MNKKLNIKRINWAMDKLGLNQSMLAKELGVSRTIVSSWFKSHKFPRPEKLLKLGVILNLPFQELVQRSVMAKEPVVAFRKKGSRKTTDIHIGQAKEMGQLLEMLVPYLPFDDMFQPPALKAPMVEYGYIQRAANRIRKEIGVKNSDPIDFEQLINKLNEFEVVLIPVLHGHREHHENALHIYLPTSKTTWIYLNLDSNIHDFKFWIAHELGHVLSPSLRGDTAEDFADTFAQVLLFSEDQAEGAYYVLKNFSSKKSQIKHIFEVSESLVISPITVYKAINNYAVEYNKPKYNLEPEIFAATTNFNKQYLKVSEKLELKEPFTVAEYIKITKNIFHSPFFDVLRVYLSENDKSAGFIQSILDTSILDAKEIHADIWLGKWPRQESYLTAMHI
ncbi:MAG: helix-turn-helix transcriptional regulator [Desulfobacteraceae bacterium]|nr:helix-turn-helix transcriptional regulator [Desulfobacteraceae bacterium]